ncbi:MAG: LysM peptidoglycan-binding domain-containing protein, partial [Phycisphaerae bacterium]
TDELDELPFDRPAMEATSTGDTTLTGDAAPASPDMRSADRPSLGPPDAERPAPGQPEPRAGEPLERPSPDIVTEPPADRTVGGEADSVTAREGETVERAAPADSPPPDIRPPRRRVRPGETMPPRRKLYTIQPGDRLIDIARDEYGDGRLWRAIKAVNPGIDENRLQIGDEIEIPSRDEAGRLTQPGVTLKEAAAAAGPPPTRPGEDSPKVARATYVVGRGDSLIKIARNVLKDETRWEEIFELNRDRLESPHLLRIGMELRLPALEKGSSGKKANED